MSSSRPFTRTVACASSVSAPSSFPFSIWSRTPSSISRCAVTPSFFRNFRTDMLKASSSTRPPLIRDQALARELGLGLLEGDVARREDDVGLDQLVLVERVAIAGDKLEHLRPQLAEGRLVALLDGRDGAVVQLVQALAVLVGEAVLALPR